MRSSTINFARVAILGAGGGIGQPLSLIMKSNKYVSSLNLYDVRGAPGVAADISHCSTTAKVTGYDKDDLAKAVDGVDLVLIPAGVPRKPGMTRDDLFNTNASIVRDLVTAVGKGSPKAIIGVISNPVNSTVPVAAGALKKIGAYDPRRLMGVTMLDIVRARTFLGELLKADPCANDVTVIGGHSGDTIVPLLSPYTQLSEEQVKALTHRIQFGGEEVIKAKAGAGSATLSMAFAGAEFATGVLRALGGEKGVKECAFVESPLQPKVHYFASPLVLGKDGVEKILPMPKLNAYEEGLLSKCLDDLQKNIAKGEAFIGK